MGQSVVHRASRQEEGKEEEERRTHLEQQMSAQLGRHKFSHASLRKVRLVLDNSERLAPLDEDAKGVLGRLERLGEGGGAGVEEDCSK